MKLSVVIPTRNEEANIASALHAFDAFRDDVETIVVDNASTDRTKAIAAELGALVKDHGPERSAQRNLGCRLASADWVIVLDADMTLPRETIEEILETIASENALDAYWIPEVRSGEGLRAKARNFERSFYNGTAIDGLRLFRKRVLLAVGGYDETLFGGEDWDLDIRILATGAKCAVLKHPLLHNERRLSLARVLAKKAYYTKSMAAYRAKWPNHPALRKQFSPVYRFVGVFVEQGKWRRLVAHPVLAAVMYVERVLVGFTYLLNK